MTIIITFKQGTQDTDLGPHRIVNVMAILTTIYSIKFVTKNNRVQSFENCDIENVSIE